MAGSKKLVYIPSIREDTWLLMSQLKDTVHFRDYAEDDRVILKSTGDQIAELLQGCEQEPVTQNLGRIPVSNLDFWKLRIDFLNRIHLVGRQRENTKLQTLFKAQCEPFVKSGDVPVVREIFKDWKDRLEKVKESTKIKEGRFNEYDEVDPLSKGWSIENGAGWQAHLLENSRRGGSPHWIETGDERTDFSLVCMELNLSISSKSNRINVGYQNSINPDGLAIRRDGHFTVVEIKGPKDENTLLSPMLQATCGALAVAAKREMICALTRTGRGRRPAYTNATVPTTRPSLGIHVITARDSGPGQAPREPWSDDVERASKTVLAAFQQLSYIAYSFVTPNLDKPFEQLAVDNFVST